MSKLSEYLLKLAQEPEPVNPTVIGEGEVPRLYMFDLTLLSKLVDIFLTVKSSRGIEYFIKLVFVESFVYEDGLQTMFFRTETSACTMILETRKQTFQSLIAQARVWSAWNPLVKYLEIAQSIPQEAMTRVIARVDQLIPGQKILYQTSAGKYIPLEYTRSLRPQEFVARPLIVADYAEFCLGALSPNVTDSLEIFDNKYAIATSELAVRLAERRWFDGILTGPGELTAAMTKIQIPQIHDRMLCLLEISGNTILPPTQIVPGQIVWFQIITKNHTWIPLLAIGVDSDGYQTFKGYPEEFRGAIEGPRDEFEKIVRLNTSNFLTRALLFTRTSQEINLPISKTSTREFFDLQDNPEALKFHRILSPDDLEPGQEIWVKLSESQEFKKMTYLSRAESDSFLFCPEESLDEPGSVSEGQMITINREVLTECSLATRQIGKKV